MTDFVEVMKQYHRMCESEDCNISNRCPFRKIAVDDCEVDDCEYYAFTNPEDFEKRVMDWAAEHPEPKYPTWGDWFVERGEMTLDFLNQPIPTDIAKKLGIEPVK